MANLLIQTKPAPMAIDLSSLVPQTQMTEAQFYAFCQTNRDCASSAR